MSTKSRRRFGRKITIVALVLSVFAGIGCNLITGATPGILGTGGGGATTGTSTHAAAGGGIGGTTSVTTTTTTTGGGGGAAPSCSDATRNGLETDVDCGGACPVCANGRACVAGTDCASGSCAQGLCAPWGTVLGESGITRSVVTSDGGDIYVAGYFALPGGAGQHHAVVKYAPSPTCSNGFCTPVWKFPPSVNGSPPFVGDICTMALDQKASMLFIAGSYRVNEGVSLPGPPDCKLGPVTPQDPRSGMLFALGTDGSCKWSKAFPGMCPVADGGPSVMCSEVRVLGVVTDGAGDVYVVGWFDTLSVDMGPGGVTAGVKNNSATLPSENVFAAKIDGTAASHPVVWARTFGSNIPARSVRMDGTAIALVPRPGGDDLVLGGYFTGTTNFGDPADQLHLLQPGGFNDGFVLALHTDNGDTDWVTDVRDESGVEPHTASTVVGLALTAKGEVAFAAVDNGSVVVGTLAAADGVLQGWAPRLPGGGANVLPSAIAASGDDLLVGWGSTKSYNQPYPPGNELFHLTRFVSDPVGGGAQKVAWQKDYGPLENAYGWNGSFGLAVNQKTHNIVLAGYFRAPSLTVVGGTLFENPGNFEAFLASLGP
jgi:hypothetical protein